jgi:hypothetical protein
MTVAEPLDATWEEFRAALNSMWLATTQASNWMMTQFYARDVRWDSSAKSLAPMPKMYLYPEARLLFPVLPPRTVAALEHACRGRYRGMRRDLIWTFANSLPTFRYPVPFPVHNQSWSAERDPSGQRPVVGVRIVNRHFRLRLKGGPQFRRQLAHYDQLVIGKAVAGELSLYQPGLGAPRVRMVAWLPREQPTVESRAHQPILVVRTAADCLLLAVNGRGESIWRYNGDHLRRWRAAYITQLQRWSEDAKYENRPIPPFATRRINAGRKFRARIDSATHEIAAQLAGFSERRHYGTVVYDDSEKSYCEQFPWFDLRRKLAEKLDQRGIRLELATAPDDKQIREQVDEQALTALGTV